MDLLVSDFFSCDTMQCYQMPEKARLHLENKAADKKSRQTLHHPTINNGFYLLKHSPRFLC